MANRIGTNLTSPVTVVDPLLNKNAFWADEGLGGLHQKNTIDDRNNIVPARRVEGLLVYVSATSKYYKLKAGFSTINTTLLDSDWEELATGGNTTVPIYTFTNGLTTTTDPNNIDKTIKLGDTDITESIVFRQLVTEGILTEYYDTILSSTEGELVVTYINTGFSNYVKLKPLYASIAFRNGNNKTGSITLDTNGNLVFKDLLANNGNNINLKTLFDKENYLGVPVADTNYFLTSNTAGIRSWAQVTPQLQSDWIETDINSKAYIKHKPILQNVVYVSTEAELVQAVEDYKNIGATIYVIAELYFSDHRQFDLSKIDIKGNNYIWRMSNFTITITSKVMNISNVRFRNDGRWGHEGETEPATLFIFSNSNSGTSNIIFDNCIFDAYTGIKNTIVNDTNPVIDVAVWYSTFALNLYNCKFIGGNVLNTYFTVKQCSGVQTYGYNFANQAFINDAHQTSYVLITGYQATVFGNQVATTNGSTYIETSGNWQFDNIGTEFGPFNIDSTALKTTPVADDELIISDSESLMPTTKRIKFGSISSGSIPTPRLYKNLAFSGTLNLDFDPIYGYSDYVLTLNGNCTLYAINESLSTIISVYINPGSYTVTLPSGYLRNGVITPNVVNVITLKCFKDPNGTSNYILNIAPYNSTGIF